MPNIHNLLLPKKTEKSIREGYDEDHEQVESDANLFDGSLDVLEFGPLIPTESERSLMERVRQELKHGLKQKKCYKEKIVDISRKSVTSVSKWPYPTYVRLYNVESSSLSLELYSEAALLDCCFEDESTSYTSGSDGCIRRYDLNAGTVGTIGRHDDIATSIVYSYEKGEVISTGLDEKIKFWVTRQREGLVFSTDAGAAVGCITVSGNNLVVCVEAAMHIYDLRTLDRNLDQPFQSYASQVAVPIRCVTSVPYSRGYAVGSVDGQVAVDFPDTSCSSEIKNGRVDGVCINAIEFSPCLKTHLIQKKQEEVKDDAESPLQSSKFPWP